MGGHWTARPRFDHFFFEKQAADALMHQLVPEELRWSNFEFLSINSSGTSWSINASAACFSKKSGQNVVWRFNHPQSLIINFLIRLFLAVAHQILNMKSV